MLKSNQFVQPAWVSIEAWIPSGGNDLTRRRKAVITIVAKEYHRFKFEYCVELSDGEWKKKWSGLRDLSPGHADVVARFVLAGGKSPRFGSVQLRDHPAKIWKPRNKPDVLGVDP